MKNKDLMKMSEPELADEIDNYLTKVVKDSENESEMIALRTAFRMLQLQLNHIKAKVDLSRYFNIILMRELPKEQRDKIMEEINKLKEEDNDKIRKEIEEMK